MEEPTKPRRGRRAKPAKPGERVSLGLKVRPEIKDRLDTDAKRSGRTQSQEAEARIEQSFYREGLLDDALELAFGRQVAGILLVIASAMTRAGRIGGFQSEGSFEAMENWLSDAYAYGQAVKAANEVLNAFRPEGDPQVFKSGAKVSDEFLAKAGAWGARITLDAIRNPNWGDQFPGENRNRDLERFAERMRNMLGPLVSRIPANEESAQ
jgi:predicted transcriptional regulator